MRRSIGDEEIALIKAMLARGMPAHAIQFRFNRPDRRVNNGRITDIKAGRYGPSDSIQAASDEVLDAFIARPSGAVSPTPIDEATLRRLFQRDRGGRWRLAGGETDQVECKANFNLRNAGPWLRPIAGLANNRGGYILFGVADKDAAGVSWVTGMDRGEFATIDLVEITRKVRATFDPTPALLRATVELNGALVGVLHVEQHPSRPVIATKPDGSDIKEGDILYRYTAQTTRIGYGDLRAMLDARDQQARKAVLPLVEQLLELDPTRVMLADLGKGRLTDGRGTIEIDEALLNRIAFIREGEFKEREGAPALRLVGDVHVAGATPTRKGVLDTMDVLRAFLTGTLDADPLDYLRHAVEVGDTGWYPVHHFAVAAGFDLPGLRRFVERSKASSAKKKAYRRKLLSTDRAHVAAGGSARAMLGRLLAGSFEGPKDAREAATIGLAIQAITGRTTMDLARAKALLAECVDATIGEGMGPQRSPVRKAIARLDELLCPVGYEGPSSRSTPASVVSGASRGSTAEAGPTPETSPAASPSS